MILLPVQWAWISVYATWFCKHGLYQTRGQGAYCRPGGCSQHMFIDVDEILHVYGVCKCSSWCYNIVIFEYRDIIVCSQHMLIDVDEIMHVYDVSKCSSWCYNIAILDDHDTIACSECLNTCICYMVVQTLTISKKVKRGLLPPRWMFTKHVRRCSCL